MKKTNKILAIILAILMVMSIIPITAGAEEIAVTYDYTVISEDEKTCRLNSDDGISRTDSVILVIPSEIDGYTVIELSDNFEYYSNTHKIVVPDSVEKIGKAFNGHDGLLTIVLGAGVSDFNPKSFVNMNYLKEFIVSEDNPYICSVDGVVFTKDMKKLLRFPTNWGKSSMYDIPDGVEVIGEEAFYQGWNLTKIEIPNSVTTIEKRAFLICNKLERIDMGKGVKTIGDYAFNNCSKLAYVSYASTEEDFYKISISTKGNDNLLNARFSFDDSDHECEFELSEVVPPTCLYDGYTLYVCSICGSEYEDNYVPATEEHIIEEVGKTNPTCTEKGYTTYACALCGSSYSSDFVSALGHNYKETETPPGETECVKAYKCSVCGYSYTVNGHSKVVTPAKVPTLTEAGNTRDERCSNCGLVYLEGQIIPALNENSFANLQGDNLIGVLDKEARTLTIYGTGTIESEYNFTSTYDKELGMNVGYTFYVDDVIIKEGVTGIGDDAFSGQPFDTYIIADSVKTIGDSAFFESFVKKIIIGDGVETIGPHAFRSCWYLKELEIGKSVKTIGNLALLHCDDLETITVDSENQYFSSDEFGVLFNKDKTTLILCPSSCEMETYTIPGTVTTIKADAFAECGKTLKSVIMPKSVTTIEESAFTTIGTMLSPTKFDIYYLGIEGEWNLINNGNGVDVDRYITVHYGENEHLTHHSETIVTPPTCTQKGCSTFICDCGLTYNYDYVDITGHKDNNSDKYCDSCNEYIGIATGIFAKTLVWTFDDVTGTLTISGSGPMSGFSTKSPWESYEKDIKTVIINEGITEINDYAFYGCENVTEVILHNGLTKIGFSSFENCYGLTTITIPDSLTLIDNYAFYSCYKLRNVKYSGMSEQWDEITIDSYNQPISYNARIHYNSTEVHTIEYKFEVIAATCFEQGYTTYTCSCGDSYVDDYVDATGHSYTSVITTPATHTTTGVMTYTCACGDTYTETIEKVIRHNYVPIVTPPTCTKIGYTTYVCSICNDSYEDDYIGETGHSYTSEITTPATHLTDGVEIFTCSNCGDSYTKAIEKTEKHNYESVVTTPICTEQGYTTYICECGDSYIDDYVDALGHNHTSEITVPATHTATGIMTYTCDCGDTYTETIEKLAEHNHNAVVTAPICTAQGYTTYACECGDTYVADYVDALGHTEEILHEVVPTCTGTGLTEGTMCSVCGETLTEQKELSANGHTPANVVEENHVAPTCAESGSKDVVVYCSVCEKEISRETETIEATGHADNDGNGYCDGCGEQLDSIVLCDHNCHKGGISGFIWKIVNFFNKLFGINKVCECGVAHY